MHSASLLPVSVSEKSKISPWSIMEMAHVARFSGLKEAVTVNEKLLYIT